MWFLCCRKAHPNRNKRHLIRSYSPRQDVATRSDLVSSEEDPTIEEKREFAEVKKSYSSNFYQQQRRRIFNISSHRSHLSYTDLTPEFLKPTDRFCARNKKIQSSQPKPQQAKEVKRLSISNPQSLLYPTPKLYRRNTHEATLCKSRKRKMEEQAREIEIKELTYAVTKHNTVTSKKLSARMTKSSNMPSERRHKHVKLSEELLHSISSPRSSSPTLPAYHAHSYILSTLDALSARPTIKCGSKYHYIPHTSISPLDDADRARPRKFPHYALMSHNKIDDLADYMSANELRDILERDRKRKEKVMADHAHTEKRPARQDKQISKESVIDKTEKQSFEEPDALKNSKKLSPLERDDSLISKKRKQKEDPYLFDDMSSSARPFSPTPIPNHRLGVKGQVDTKTRSTSKTGYQSFLEVLKQKPKRKTRSRIFPLPRSMASTAVMLPKEVNNHINDSNTKPTNIWTSFLKIGCKNERASTEALYYTPSSVFTPSADALESCCKNFQPASVNNAKYALKGFRECLADYPNPSMLIHSGERADLREAKPQPESHEYLADGIKTSIDKSCGHKESFGKVDQPSSMTMSGRQLIDADPYDPNALSQSLGSIDSEASWLSSGREVKGVSFMYHQPPGKKSISLSLPNPVPAEPLSEYVEGIDEDDYFGPISPIDQEHVSSFLWDDDDDATEASGEPTKWGAVDRRPHMVYRSPLERKSREGLLNDFEAESTDLSPKQPNIRMERCSQASWNDTNTRPRSRAATLGSDQNYTLEFSGRVILKQKRFSCW